MSLLRFLLIVEASVCYKCNLYATALLMHCVGERAPEPLRVIRVPGRSWSD